MNTDLLKEAAIEFKTYCLGVGCMPGKCENCQHERNWQTLNQMPNALRLATQKDMKRIDQTGCQLTSGLYFSEVIK